MTAVIIAAAAAASHIGGHSDSTSDESSSMTFKYDISKDGKYITECTYIDGKQSECATFQYNHEGTTLFFAFFCLFLLFILLVTASSKGK
jgi:hypothetical protein